MYMWNNYMVIFMMMIRFFWKLMPAWNENQDLIWIDDFEILFLTSKLFRHVICNLVFCNVCFFSSSFGALYFSCFSHFWERNPVFDWWKNVFWEKISTRCNFWTDHDRKKSCNNYFKLHEKKGIIFNFMVWFHIF